MRIDDISQLGPDAQRQVQAKMALKLVDESKRKYGNKPCMINGVRFDSLKEGNRFRELSILLRAGEITDLRLQPEFTLIEAWMDTEGNKHNAMRYRADFSYRRNGELIIEDVKSEATRRNRVYINKRKMMAERGYEVSEL